MHYKKNISFILILFFILLLQAGALAQASFEGLVICPGEVFLAMLGAFQQTARWWWAEV